MMLALASAQWFVASLVFEPSPAGWLSILGVVAGIGAIIAAYTLGLRWRHLPLRSRAAMLGLRLLATVVLLVALLHPVWIRQNEATRRPTVAVIVDDSESMSLPADLAAPASGSRWDRAAGAIRNDLAPRLGSAFDVRLFDVEGRPLDAADLPDAPTGGRSPLTQTLHRVAQDLRSDHLAGIVLVSDGVEVADQATAADVSQLPVPVHTLAIAARAAQTGQPDIAIQSITTNRRAIAGNAVNVAVDVAAAGGADVTRLPVSIVHDGRVVASSAVRLSPGEPAKRVELAFIPPRPGEFEYVVQVGKVADEVALGNNRETFRLTVRAEALTVMYIDGVLRWEGKFIRKTLGDDPDVNLIQSVRTTPPDVGGGSQGLALGEQLADVDVLILGDIEASFFSAAEISAIDRWVREAGGGLVLTGGYRSFGSEGFGRTELARLLPVSFSAAANPQVEQAFSLKLTEAGREHAIFHLTGDKARDAAFYQQLPKLAGCSRIAAVKPGAQVLAVNPTLSGPGGAEGLPIIVAQDIGAGRAMVLAIDTTWRWRMIVGGYTPELAGFYDRFWGQLVRWMARAEDHGEPVVQVASQRAHYKPGETIHLSVRLGEAAGNDPGIWRVGAKAIDEEGQVVALPLAQTGPGAYEGTIGAQKPGRLDVLVTATPTGAGDAAASDTVLTAQSQVLTINVERPDLELLDRQPDPQWLAQASQLTGGQVIKPDGIAQWAERLRAEPVTVTTTHTARLWHHPLLAGLFFLAICTEWILRRRARLA